MPPKLDHIQRIRRENQTLSKLTPFNFCDYWCKHCLEDIRNVCQVYLHEDNVIRKSLETGDDLFSIDMILKKIESLVTGTSQHLDLLLEANPNSKSALKGEKLLEESDSCSNHPLRVEAKEFFKNIHKILITCLGNDKGWLIENAKNLESLAWYHSLLLEKTKSMITAVYDRGPGELLMINTVVAQVDVCHQAVLISEQVLVSLIKTNSNILPAQVTLHNLRDELTTLEGNLEVELMLASS